MEKSDRAGSQSVQEIADALGAERGDVLLALNVRRPMRSLDETLGGDDGPRLMDVVGEDTLADVEQRLTLSKLLQDLPDDERTLILRRYFKRHTQAQIAGIWAPPRYRSPAWRAAYSRSCGEGRRRPD